MKWLFESEVEDLKIIFRDTGFMLSAIGIATALPALVSMLYGELLTMFLFLFTALLFIALGFFFSTSITVQRTGGNKHALLSVSLTWLIAIFLGSIPFLVVHPPLDALFESTAGFTTTAFTFFENTLEIDKGLLFWRCLQQFAGGLLFVISFLALSKSFEPGSEAGFRERMRELGAKVSRVYLYLALAGFLLFMLAGTTAFEAISYSLSSISTGGFSVNGSLGAINNPRAVVVALLLTITGSLNILLILKLIEGDISELFKNSEVIATLLLISLGVLAMRFTRDDFLIEMYHFFSALTTSGFMIVETSRLRAAGEFYKAVLIGVMLIGGGVYSMAGGLKMHRLVVLLKSLYWRVTTQLPDKPLPARRIHNIKDLVVSDEDILRVQSFIGLFLAVFTASALLTSSYGYPVLDSFFETASALSNVGLTTGIVSPLMPVGVKILLMLDMILGRAEVLGILGLALYFTEKIKVVTLGR